MSVEQGFTPYTTPAPAVEDTNMGVTGLTPETAPEVEPITPAPPRDETERLDPPVTAVIALESGTEIEIEALRLRQFLRLLRIVTRGASDILDSANLDFENPQEFLQTFLAMVLFSIPEAEEETVVFLQSMVRPKNLTGNPSKDLITTRELSLELENPSLDDTMTIITSIVQKESEDLRSLGKRIAGMLKSAEKMGLTKSNPVN